MSYHFETLQLHVGQEQPDPATGARAVPIYQTTSYVFRDCAQAAARFGLTDAGNIYGRLTNSTQDVLEQRVAALEGGVAALATASGAAAVTYTIQALARQGGHIVAQKTIYGGTYNLLAHTLPQYGITATFVDAHDAAAVEAAIQPNTRAVYLETLGNPNCDIPNIEAIAAVAHRHGLPLVIDNTFGTPYWVKVIPLGADTTGSRYLDPDGRFPNHVPNPELPEAMDSIREAVLESHADFGVIFDTDVDRAGAVLSNGEELNRNRLIALISAILLREHPGTAIVTDSITSTGLAEFIAAHGGVHRRFRRGYRNVINEALRLNAAGQDCQLAIETSGHAALKENYFLDDGAYLVTRFLMEIAAGRSLESLLEGLYEPVGSRSKAARSG